MVHSVYRPQTALPLCRVLLNRRGGGRVLLKRGGGGGRVLLKRGGGAECCLRHCTTRRTVSYKASGPDASGMYDASYSVVQGVGARRVGDVRRVGRCRGPTRRKIPISTVVEKLDGHTSAATSRQHSVLVRFGLQEQQGKTMFQQRTAGLN